MGGGPGMVGMGGAAIPAGSLLQSMQRLQAIEQSTRPEVTMNEQMWGVMARAMENFRGQLAFLSNTVQAQNAAFGGLIVGGPGGPVQFMQIRPTPTPSAGSYMTAQDSSGQSTRGAGLPSGAGSSRTQTTAEDWDVGDQGGQDMGQDMGAVGLTGMPSPDVSGMAGVLAHLPPVGYSAIPLQPPLVSPRMPMGHPTIPLQPILASPRIQFGTPIGQIVGRPPIGHPQGGMQSFRQSTPLAIRSTGPASAGASAIRPTPSTSVTQLATLAKRAKIDDPNATTPSTSATSITDVRGMHSEEDIDVGDIGFGDMGDAAREQVTGYGQEEGEGEQTGQEVEEEGETGH